MTAKYACLLSNKSEIVTSRVQGNTYSLTRGSLSFVQTKIYSKTNSD